MGFISVTSQVDLSILWECYQLESYHGLRKLCEEDEIISTPSHGNQLPSTEDTGTATPTPERYMYMCTLNYMYMHTVHVELLYLYINVYTHVHVHVAISYFQF